MFAAACPSDHDARDALAAIRASGGVCVAAKAEDAGPTRIAALAERGGYRAKFPDAAGPGLEAVVVNTGGGVAGGDRIDIVAHATAGARLTLTTATAERIYRSNGPMTTIDVSLRAGKGARLGWLPQGTILFSGSRMRRRLTVDADPDARVLIAETLVFGREASDEEVREGVLRDTWHVQRGGRLVFADATRLDGDIAAELSRPAVAAGARTMTQLVALTPDAEPARDLARSAIAGVDACCDIGISAWNGMLVMRALLPGLATAQRLLREVIKALNVAAVPTAWAGDGGQRTSDLAGTRQ